MNHKLSSILVGFDFSDPSFNAISTATSLAIKENATLHLVYAHETIYERIVLGKPLLESSSNISSVLTALATDISRKSGVKTQVVEDTGHAAEIILRNIGALNCDLVVMGTHGASGVRSGFTGSTACTIAKYSPCPVLLVPGGRQWRSFNNPIYPLRPVMTAMRHYGIIRRFIEKQSSLLLFALTRKGEEKDETMIRETLSHVEDSLKNDQVITSIAWDTDHSVSQNVLTQADKNRSDLIILTTAIDVSNKLFFIGPISHFIIHNSRIPVLVINKVNSHSLSQARSAM